ncbi:MAG: hypothetical protein ACRDK3_16105 [Actinomycetota bacterium]
MSRSSQSQWAGPSLWFFWGALMGFGALGIFSIGIPLLLVGLGLLIPLSKSRRAGAWMALVGAATPWATFAAEGYVSPDCADGTTTIGPSGNEHFRCDLMQSTTEFVPFLVVSLGVMILGLTLFFLARCRRSRDVGYSPG